MSRITVPTLFQFGSFIFPTDYIKIDTFDASPNQRQDLDSYTDANGLTHRNAVEHSKTQIKFTTRQLRSSEYEEIMSGITSNYKNKRERDANCLYWDWEYNKMTSGHFYLDPSLKVRMVNLIPPNASDRAGGEVYLIGEINWTFIEY